jgi:hypothetical protein
MYGVFVWSSIHKYEYEIIVGHVELRRFVMLLETNKNAGTSAIKSIEHYEEKKQGDVYILCAVVSVNVRAIFSLS